MKKMIFSAAAFALVAVSSIALAPTTASAIPAFARQTGAACLSCHFQTFPALKPFGRAFKMGSFTDVGDQALIEDDDLSIPAVLNATFNLEAQYTNSNVTGQQSTGTYELPSKAVLMIAGRLGSNTGAFIGFMGGKKGLATTKKLSAGGKFATNSGVRAWQLLNSFDVGGFKVGLSAASTPFGGSAIMEVSNVFGQHSDKLGGSQISAIEAAGFTQGTTALGTWVGNDLGYVQFALVAPAIATAGSGSAAGNVNVGLSLGKLVRVVATLDVGGWDTLIGFGSVTGSAGKGDTAGGLTAVRVPMDIKFIDFQMQGAVGDMSVGIYADWAKAKGKDSGIGTAIGLNSNFYGSFTENGVTFANGAGNDFTAYSVRADIEPINRVLLGVGYGYSKLSGVSGGTVTNTDVTRKTFHLAATYKIYQNFDLNVTFNNIKLNDPTKTLRSAAGASFTNRETVIGLRALL